MHACIQAVSGRFLNTSFDPVSSKFSLTFEADTSIKSTTDCLIYLNEKLYYPNGYNVMYVSCIMYMFKSPLILFVHYSVHPDASMHVFKAPNQVTLNFTNDAINGQVNLTSL